MLSSITRFLRDEEGATAIEYGIIAGLISVAIVTILGTLGTNLNSIFKTISDEVANALPKTPG